MCILVTNDKQILVCNHSLLNVMTGVDYADTRPGTPVGGHQYEKSGMLVVLLRG